MKEDQTGAREGYNADWDRDALQRMTAEELIDDLEEKIEEMDDLTFDEDILDAYLEELEQKEPLNLEFDAKASLAIFHAEHPEISGDIKSAKRGTHWKVLRLAAGLVAATLGCMLVAQAAGADVFGIIARWSDEKFQFRTTEAIGTPPPAPKLSPGEVVNFGSIQEALDAANIQVKLSPTWIPVGFTLDEVTARAVYSSVTVDAFYSGEDDRFLGIMVQPQWSSNTFSVFEKDDGQITEYEKNGIIYFIMTNRSQVSAAWVENNYECAIWGDITKEEMIQIIDSIQ